MICLRSGEAAPTLDLDFGLVCRGKRSTHRNRSSSLAGWKRHFEVVYAEFFFFFGTSRNQRARGPSRNPVGLNENVLPPLYYENSPLAGINSFCVRRLLERKTCDGV
jgi:hypothetical protein